ncbi:MAG TPA: hypothetical protein VKY92_12810 [Verrucomicrobiae bacterium]|nr:hypothetical protein [Verrucomicrobiae bacterium]
MKTLIAWLLWCILFVLCWPVAVAALAIIPLTWLLLVPFRVASTAVRAVFGLLKGVVLLPARLAGWRAR